MLEMVRALCSKDAPALAADVIFNFNDGEEVCGGYDGSISTECAGEGGPRSCVSDLKQMRILNTTTFASINQGLFEFFCKGL